MNHLKTDFLNHLKNHFKLCYKGVCNQYYYAHFNPVEVAYYVRLFHSNV
ncbi:Hypothetical protein I595_2776 [Croceitalea dokdonensis DOKDO 023]|uniref:Uncharacterized protein n=1 Tax=Croceitalea dokdonensis DOKDO 023 TaxID=1300341 RepID=A0A0P7AYN3_9FLAO|nr:Hypothetical protein I595_2776 [Croceitalea dokdonensis DOKDO 023]